MPDEYKPYCEVCGDDGTYRTLNITFTRNNETTCYCTFCERLVKDGLLRPETINGQRRYRQWHPGEWHPGDLLPTPRQDPEVGAALGASRTGPDRSTRARVER